MFNADPTSPPAPSVAPQMPPSGYTPTPSTTTTTTAATQAPASELPQTGQHDGAWAGGGIGVALILIGAAMLVMLRRRRSRTD